MIVPYFGTLAPWSNILTLLKHGRIGIVDQTIKCGWYELAMIDYRYMIQCKKISRLKI